ncbi:lysosome membrane protein 2-like isoform X1 [Pomacea canaliculata]|uniref:lysosome membrane protein 2-like isoform X1 n=1 Tax=Pomacea canaliculata TaxID=400727 RepID=UPI000D73FB1C|nr:lysosome membrane protein 2-like isoform X1 [Pomacea canaliculata]
MGRKFTVCAAVWLVIGIVFLCTGCVLIYVFAKLIRNKIDSSLPLKTGSDSYNDWVSPPAPIFFQIWVFDVTNHDEVLKLGAKPNLNQIGPFTYRETRRKGNITFTDHDTVLYREKQWFVFDRSLSCSKCDETRNFTTVNLPMLTIANLVQYEYNVVKDIVDFMLRLSKEHLFINLTVADLLWGYEDSLLKDAKTVFGLFNISLKMDDKFGLFYQKNGSDTGLYEIYTGTDSLDHFAEILRWNGNETLDFWTTPIANMINGSDGTMYPPFIDTSRAYYLFSSDVCRSLEIRYVNGYELKDIDLDRFVVPSMVFANASVNPDNLGYCTPHAPENCLPSGILNGSNCQNGAPVIFSLPHFLYGDETIQNRVDGMHPNQEEHQSVIDIEPMTGVVMNVAKRLQINAYVHNISNIIDVQNIHDYIVLPILWLNESAEIDDKSASDFKSKVLNPLKITEGVKYSLIAVGGLIVVVCLICVIIKCMFYKKRETELMPVTETTPILQGS